MKDGDRIQSWRRLVHILCYIIFLVLPFVKIGGESAFRFDVPSLRLHLFGIVIPMDEFFLVLLVVLFLLSLFMWGTISFGRVWCGWLCPQTVLVELAAAGGKKKGRRLGRWMAGQATILPVSILTGAVTLWYFVPPFDFIGGLAGGDPGLGGGGRLVLGSWAVLSLLVWLDLVLVRYTFCATVCPYSRFQGVMFDGGTMVIARDGRRAEECLDCSACARVCPVGIDIREGLQAACINCAECIDACARVMERKGRKSLVGYVFGAPGRTFRFRRPAVLVSAGAALLFLTMFFTLLSGRSSLQVALLPRKDIPPRVSSTGNIVNSFELSIENRGDDDELFRLSARGEGGAARISPGVIEIAAGAHRRVGLVVSTSGGGAVNILLTGKGGEVHRVGAYISLPE